MRRCEASHHGRATRHGAHRDATALRALWRQGRRERSRTTARRCDSAGERRRAQDPAQSWSRRSRASTRARSMHRSRAILAALPETRIDALSWGSVVVRAHGGRARAQGSRAGDTRDRVEPEGATVFSGGVTGPTKMHDPPLASYRPASIKITDEIRSVSDARAWSTKLERHARRALWARAPAPQSR
jgi:hypothetical protein